MENPDQKLFLKWGLILGLSLAIFSLIQFMMGLATNTAVGYISWLILAVVLFFAIREARSQGGGYLKFGEGVKLSVLASLIAGLIEGAFKAVYVTVVEPGIIDEIRSAALEEVGNNPQVTDEMLDQSLVWIERMTSPGALFGLAVLGTLFLGLIFGLIISAILRRDIQPEA